MRKTRACLTLFDFMNDGYERDKELKKTYLIELIDYLTNYSNKFNEMMIREVFNLVEMNLFRPLPPRLNPTGN